MSECDRCGVEITEGNWGVSLYDDYVGLQGSYSGPVQLCEGCRDDFEEWLDG